MMIISIVVYIILKLLLSSVTGYQFKSNNKIINNHWNNNDIRKISSSSSVLMSTPPYKGPDTTPILDSIQSPSDMKRLSTKQLKQLSHELRWDTINKVAKV